MARASGLMILGAAAACVLLELLFRVLPVSTSTAMDYYVDERILSYQPHHSHVAAGGWDLRHPQRLQANNMGFIASREFANDPTAVAFIGDSFVEASMLDAQDRPADQLERTLAGRPVYAFGAPGSSLLDYAERVRFAATRFGVRDFVILIEEGDVLQAICGSGQVHGRCYDEKTGAIAPFRQGSAGTLKRILRQSALAQYLTSQLKLDVGGLLSWRPAKSAEAGASPVQPAPVDRSGEFAKIVDAFFTEISPHRKGRLVLILEDRTVSGMKRSELQTQARQVLVTKASEAGATVLDTGPLFRTFVSQTGLSVAVSPGDHHWNRAATALVAEQVATDFREPAASQPSSASTF
jgi:hypothetical protein